MLARTRPKSAALFPKAETDNFGWVPSIDEPKMKCNPPIPARLCRRVTVTSRHRRHICGKLCPYWGAHLVQSQPTASSVEPRSGLPAAIWLFHFLEMGEALPELVGEADWRPASRAMMSERLRVRRDAGHYLHLLNGVCACFMGNHKTGVTEEILTAQG